MVSILQDTPISLGQRGGSDRVAIRSREPQELRKDMASGKPFWRRQKRKSNVTRYAFKDKAFEVITQNQVKITIT